jgi:hypothetical protein
MSELHGDATKQLKQALNVMPYVVIKCNAKYGKTSKLNASNLKLIDKPCRLPD